ncbi:MAG: hypothetical protein DRQ47_08960, partial [Gammaproteobacteria bacterium]
DVVMVPFAWREPGQLRDTLYSAHDEAGNVLLGFSDAVKALQKKEIEDEKLRLFYVALTRASRHLVLFFIDNGTKQTSKNGPKPSKNYNQSPLGWYFPTGSDDQSVQSAHSSFEKALQEVNQGCAGLDDCDIPDLVEGDQNDKDDSPERAGKDFSAKVDNRIGTTSFTMITKGYSVALKDDDEEDDKGSEQQEDITPEGRHALAKGAHIGTALHHSLEFTDFTRWSGGVEETDKQLLASLVRRELKANGVIVDNEKLELALPEYSQWVMEVINTPFLNTQTSNGVALKDLTDWYPELNFTFSLLNRRFSKAGLGDLLTQLGYNITGLSGGSIYGMLKGEIDLVFLHDGKYYLADYKSNHLGNDYSAYTAESLKVSNDKKAYTLQYLIYTVALHKHLAERIHDYDYETHFGGVFYLYLRGMHPEQQNKGVFFDLPRKSDIEALSNYFSAAAEDAASIEQSNGVTS